MKEMKQEGCKDREARDFVSFVSCRSSAVAYTEEMSPESPGKMQRVRLRGVRRGEKKKMCGGWNQKGKRRRRKP